MEYKTLVPWHVETVVLLDQKSLHQIVLKFEKRVENINYKNSIEGRV
ncbi:hypothetical protein SDC9_192735 [bioreactor metagenome]|uniref:Uncharacterized protein n=1 Tax=bioreactor metagenome TaxID=1076179 RepID=A0A645I1P6_9ZZZZ